MDKRPAAANGSADVEYRRVVGVQEVLPQAEVKADLAVETRVATGRVLLRLRLRCAFGKIATVAVGFFLELGEVEAGKDPRLQNAPCRCFCHRRASVLWIVAAVADVVVQAKIAGQGNDGHQIRIFGGGFRGLNPAEDVAVGGGQTMLGGEMPAHLSRSATDIPSLRLVQGNLFLAGMPDNDVKPERI